MEWTMDWASFWIGAGVGCASMVALEFGLLMAAAGRSLRAAEKKQDEGPPMATFEIRHSMPTPDQVPDSWPAEPDEDPS